MVDHQIANIVLFVVAATGVMLASVIADDGVKPLPVDDVKAERVAYRFGGQWQRLALAWIALKKSPIWSLAQPGRIASPSSSLAELGSCATWTGPVSFLMGHLSNQKP